MTAVLGVAVGLVMLAFIYGAEYAVILWETPRFNDRHKDDD
ncbi:Uncharacterised protein [Mycobacteroides abscessus subsp. abscessus]|nr:hypothetical protein [Mycobacteroides abscessus]SIC56815.1 Uncharacterised protein [Mycobacteroides abscessus subsp. abscessus]SKU57482.1 Uncharacterised protein [Mycobacteroides abscessus subsp. abscessus]